jgi:Na+/H+ antiporter NhaD/arsenite permease-like protein
MVKELVQNMIKEHLGWLVIWGAVFGGLIGLISTIIL